MIIENKNFNFKPNDYIRVVLELYIDFCLFFIQIVKYVKFCISFRKN